MLYCFMGNSSSSSISHFLLRNVNCPCIFLFSVSISHTFQIYKGLGLSNKHSWAVFVLHISISLLPLPKAGRIICAFLCPVLDAKSCSRHANLPIHIGGSVLCFLKLHSSPLLLVYKSMPLSNSLPVPAQRVRLRRRPVDFSRTVQEEKLDQALPVPRLQRSSNTCHRVVP